VNRRAFLAAGAAGAATLALPQLATAADTGPYGSGYLGPWTGLARSISTDRQILPCLDRDGVFAFGDSIAKQDGAALAQQVYNELGDLMAVNYWNGRPTAPAVDALEQWANTYGLPSRILMLTGSNDIFSPPAFRAQVDRTMGIVGSNRTVIWVNIHVSRWSQPASVQVADQRNSGWVNVQLAEAQLFRYPKLRVVHWAELLAGKPGYRISTYLRDGVHTSVPLGQAARNAMIVQALT
jgi:hypothetical protein